MSVCLHACTHAHMYAYMYAYVYMYVYCVVVSLYIHDYICAIGLVTSYTTSCKEGLLRTTPYTNAFYVSSWVSIPE